MGGTPVDRRDPERNVVVEAWPGRRWTPTLRLSDRTDTHADATRLGDTTHVLLYGSSPELVSLEYVAATGSYQPWSARPAATSIALPNSETATIEVDSAGRMWLASEDGSVLYVRYADAPYSSFSTPITLDSNINDDDIGLVTRLTGGRIGVLWSNQNTRRFGFKVHVDGTAPSTWSADESPASQSANDAVGEGMADDHLNVALASDGTLYAAVKTGWDTAGYAKIALLIRRPNGAWDPLYYVDDAGTRPVVLLNEQDATLRLIYTSIEGFNDIVMKVTSTARISFGPRETVMSGGLNNVTRAKANNPNESVVLASSASMTAGLRLVLQPVVNQAPVFSTDFTNRTDAEGAVISLDANATDPDGNPLTYSATNLPSGITINASSGVISGTLSATSSGIYNVVITVSDGGADRHRPLHLDGDRAEHRDHVCGRHFRADLDQHLGQCPDRWHLHPPGQRRRLRRDRWLGTISMPAPGATRSALLNASATDVDFSFRVRSDKAAVGGNQYIYGVVRRNGANEYRVKLRFAPNGAVFVGASTVINNVETNIGSEVQVPGLTHTANAIIRFRAQVTGTSPTTLRVRAWADASRRADDLAVHRHQQPTPPCRLPARSACAPTSPSARPMHPY